MSLLLIGAHAHAIVGGKVPSAQDPIRGVTVLVSNEAEDDNCTGTKIAPNYVLTAGHCKNLSQIVLTADGKRVKVVKSWSHPKWAPDTKDSYDFAVLKIFPGLPGPYAKIADKSLTPKKGDKVWIAGYGDTKAGNWEKPSLHKIPVSVQNPDFAPSGIEIEEHNFGACAGDSGGPGYFLKNGQVIVWGADSADQPEMRMQCGDGEIYAKVAAAHDWINSVVAGKQPTIAAAPVRNYNGEPAFTYQYAEAGR